MNRYQLESCCSSCAGLGEVAPTGGMSILGFIELGLAAYGAYKLLGTNLLSGKRKRSKTRRRR